MIVLIDEEIRNLVGCPCGAPPGGWCLTKQGNPRASHRVRVRNANDFVEKWSKA